MGFRFPDLAFSKFSLFSRGIINLPRLSHSPRIFFSVSATMSRDTTDQVPAPTTARLGMLRRLMKERNIDVYIIPSEDSHASEYIAACHARREFITGFTGSAGCAVVTHEKAALATDGRYFNQATRQLDHNWILLKQGVEDVPTWQEWSAEQATGGKTVAVDPTLISASGAKKLAEKLNRMGNTNLIPVDDNLIDIVWSSSRPPLPANPVKILSQKFSGKDISEKLVAIRREIAKKNAAGMVISMLDEIAWLFNLRGSDIPFNPVFFAYAIIKPDSATIYVDEAKLDHEVRSYLDKNLIRIRPYSAAIPDMQHEGQSVSAPGPPGLAPAPFLISTKASWALKLALEGKNGVEELRSPIGDAKAVKNAVELEGMRACHIRDGAALIEFFAWLENELIHHKAEIDEVAAANKLEQFRSRKANFVGLSFKTISSTGPNAAIIHYSPDSNNCATINPQLIYLCDSGAQYLDGTTDTTRTIHFGQPSELERKAYTLVLKGNIALDTAIYPKGTTGFALDCLARQYLWREGLDYRHGTGHGVGSYLNVHEGPIGIGTRVQYTEVALSPGNVVSIEPGYYEDGVFGIRIENLAIVREVHTPFSFGEKPYLGFEHVTMVPYCRKLIDINLLTDAEKQWLNQYNIDILAKTRPFFEDDPLTLAWLERETQPF